MFAIGDERWPGISKLSEEAGEVLQVVGKLMGTGGEREHWNIPDLKEALEHEIADLSAAIDFVIAYCAMDRDAIHKRMMNKIRLFEHWHEQARLKREHETKSPT